MHSRYSRCTWPQRALVTLFAALLFPLSIPSLRAQACSAPDLPCVKTAQYNNARDGHNPLERVLTSASLSPTCTSGCASLTPLPPLLVDSDELPAGWSTNPIYAQPLYVTGVKTGLSTKPNCNLNPCNMLIAATLNDTVFAWNADTGNLLWSRQGYPGNSPGNGGNALWYDDCGAHGGPVAPFTVLPFAGIVSTPVIDTSAATPLMFLTDLCQTAGGVKQWNIHQIDLKTGADVLSTPISDTTPHAEHGDSHPDRTVTFEAAEVIQRSALLEVIEPNAKPTHLIYVPFASAVNETANPYHGWLLGYSADLTQEFTFDTTPAGPLDGGVPACTSGCTCIPTCTPECVLDGYQGAPNWCGQGGGIWMSSRGGAAAPDSKGVSHAFFGVGNGAFQQNSSQTGVVNWGQSILDFELPSEHLGTPRDYFTPQGGTTAGSPAVFTNLLLGNGTNVLTTNCGTADAPAGCAATFQSLNQNDWDMSTGGIALFSDDSGNNWLVTAGKEGLGYLLPQGSLGGYAPNDPNNWPFLMSFTPCWSVAGNAGNCDRITSLAVYQDKEAIPHPTHYLYYWPANERLTRLTYYDSPENLPGSGTILSEGTSVAGSGATFLSQLVPGDTITASSGGTVETHTVVAIASDTALTLDQAFSFDLPADTSYGYDGYFVQRVYDMYPPGTDVAYPGGAVSITSENGNNGVIWGLATVLTAPGSATTCPTYQAILNAYDDNLDLLWSSYNAANEVCKGGCFTIARFPPNPGPSTGCGPIAATFALPTVANGNVYIPTFSFTNSSGAPQSGILVYCGTGTIACNGNWQN